MAIIGNIEDDIVVIYEIKSFYVTLAAGENSNNIHRANYHFTHNKKLKKKPTILPYHRWVVLCTVKDLFDGGLGYS
jgi:hypothetical protein